jgi:mannitol-1-phosphate 5-dehydrogenase
MNGPKPKVVVFGAGATGRGHVGLLAWQSGAQVVFVDIDQDLIQRLRSAGAYRVNLHDHRRSVHLEVTGATFLNASERDGVAREIVDADLVLTSVFDQNLPDVAVTAAKAVSGCRLAGRTVPLNVIACENMQHSSSTLGRYVRELLEPLDLEWANRHLGFPDCMISRVVPRPEPDPLVITAEDYNEWTARREDFQGQPLSWLSALELVDNQDARLERKLFMHNGGHAVCGYFGFHYGHQFIHEAVADPRVAECVIGACDEIGEVVRRKHGFSPEEINQYKEDLYRRGAIPEMRDQILRVVRQPLRKLGGNERLLGPASLALEYALPRQHIIAGIVAALKYAHPADEQSVAMQTMLAEKGPRAVLAEAGKLDPHHPLLDEVEQGFRSWKL